MYRSRRENKKLKSREKRTQSTTSLGKLKQLTFSNVDQGNDGIRQSIIIPLGQDEVNANGVSPENTTNTKKHKERNTEYTA